MDTEEDFDEDRNLDALTGVMTVRSGRWLPPAHGWLLRITSPSFKLFSKDLICTVTQTHNIVCVRTGVSHLGQ